MSRIVATGKTCTNSELLTDCLYLATQASSRGSALGPGQVSSEVTPSVYRKARLAAILSGENRLLRGSGSVMGSSREKKEIVDASFL